MRYVAYLRKSRADEEAEQHGEGDTLARHEKTLLNLSAKMQLPISAIYREVVSGETIVSRPVMQKLLSEVENGMWDGVFVVEVERLSRGDSIDQGVVAQAFKYSNTKIITPVKTYNPLNEFDEEYFEFGLFMSRREYKTINRRIQSGRVASAREGKYSGNKSPFGYRRIKYSEGKGYTLDIVENEAEIVRKIFELYTRGNPNQSGELSPVGATTIANILNALGSRTATGGEWKLNGVTGILRNPVYMGKIKWGARAEVKRVVDGNVKKSRPRKRYDEMELYDGLHPSIVDSDTWYEAQNIMQTHKITSQPTKYIVKNPLAGVVICGKCGTRMTRRPYKDRADVLLCQNTKCDTASAPLNLVENAVLTAIEKQLDKLKIDTKNTNNAHDERQFLNSQLKYKISEMDTIRSQVSSLHDLLEQGIYSKETFLQRNGLLGEKIQKLSSEIQNIQSQIDNQRDIANQTLNVIPTIKNVMKTYRNTSDKAVKNKLLKSIVDRAVYSKVSGGRWKVAPDDFTIDVELLITSYISN